MSTPVSGKSLRRTLGRHGGDNGAPKRSPRWSGLAVALVLAGGATFVFLSQARTAGTGGWKSLHIAQQSGSAASVRDQVPERATAAPAPAQGARVRVIAKAQAASHEASAVKPALKVVAAEAQIRAKIQALLKQRSTAAAPAAAKRSAAKVRAPFAPARPAPPQRATQVASSAAALPLDSADAQTTAAAAAAPPPTPAGQQPAPKSTTAVVAQAAAPDPAPTEIYAPEVVVDARFINEVRPEYPDIAKETGQQGSAVVLVTIGPKGNVVSAKIGQSAGNAMLDQAALKAARASTFQAPRIDGKAATETYRIVYNFSL